MKKTVSDTGRLIQTGVTALIGTAFLAQTAGAISKL